MLRIIQILAVLAALSIPAVGFAVKRKKESSISTLLVTSGLLLIAESFSSLWGKVFDWIAKLPTGTDWVELIAGGALLVVGVYGTWHEQRKLYILNINAYRRTRIEDRRESLDLSPFEFKEEEIDLVRLYNKGIDNVATEISEEIVERVGRFVEETRKIRRAFTGIAPIPFIMLAGRSFGKEVISEYFELDKATGLYYRFGRNRRHRYETLTVSIPLGQAPAASEMVLAVSVTSRVAPADLAQFQCPHAEASLALPRDNVIRSEEQLNCYAKTVYETVERLSKDWSSLQRIHLIYAGPSCLAFKIGTLLDDTRTTEVVSYQYDRQGSARYPWGLVLNRVHQGQLIKS